MLANIQKESFVLQKQTKKFPKANIEMQPYQLQTEN